MTNLKIVDDSAECEPPEPFLVAMAELMQARAACAACEARPSYDAAAAEEEEEAITTGVCEAEEAAEWKLLRTPALTLLHIRLRAQVVQEMIIAADHKGRPADNCHHLMLSTLVSEIQRYTP
jgi:hypothetical protein